MEVSIKSKAIEHQINIVLNFDSSFSLLLDLMDPIVNTLMATSITLLCSIPKNRNCLSWIDSEKLFRKYWVIGLNTYKYKPNKSWMWDTVRVVIRKKWWGLVKAFLTFHPTYPSIMATSRNTRTTQRNSECKLKAKEYIKVFWWR
jgi:hypothetical protein